MPGIVGFAGSLSQPSRTRALVSRAVHETANMTEFDRHVFDLQDLGPSLGQARQIADLAPEARALVDQLVNADALVLGSPVYKGSYTGLFKHLFDLIEPDALRGVPVLLVATGGGDRHTLVIEHQFRPLFGFFEAATIPTGIYASSAHFLDGQLVSPRLEARLQTAVGQLVGALMARPRLSETTANQAIRATCSASHGVVQSMPRTYRCETQVASVLPRRSNCHS
jgi:FMN reductase